MCGINASREEEHGCRFTMCHASLKMGLLLHKEGLVKTTVPITVCRLLKRHKVTTFIIHFYEKLTSHFQNVKVYYPQEEIVLLSFV